MDENEISKVILDAAIAVHNELGGPGTWRTICLNNSIPPLPLCLFATLR